VGSTPFESTDKALDFALTRLGGRLRTLPDGETGARRNWIIHIVESLRNHPASTRFIAGVVHEQRSLDEERELLSLIDGLTGRQVDVATACGLGRRDREAALATIDQAAALCEEVTPRGS
jgi:hypothetical protein